MREAVLEARQQRLVASGGQRCWALLHLRLRPPALDAGFDFQLLPLEPGLRKTRRDSIDVTHPGGLSCMWPGRDSRQMGLGGQSAPRRVSSTRSRSSCSAASNAFSAALRVSRPKTPRNSHFRA